MSDVDVPTYDHDCEACIFLGHDSNNPGEPRANVVDLYICIQGHRKESDYTVLRRYSSEPSNYGSVPLVHAGPRYARARALAIKAGIIKEP